MGCKRTPETRARMSAAAKRRYADPANREAAAARYKDPAVKQAHSAAVKAGFAAKRAADHAWRLTGRKPGGVNTESWRKAQSEAMKAKWREDPAYRQRVMDGLGKAKDAKKRVETDQP